MTDTDQDNALINAALAGSARAWELLVRQYEGRIYNYGLRLTGNPTDAMDLLQEVFLAVYRNLPNFRGDARFTTWLFSIAHNKAADINRRQRPLAAAPARDPSAAGLDLGSAQNAEAMRPSWPLGSSGGSMLQGEPDAELAAAQTNDKSARLLAALSWEQRLQVELKIYQSLTFEEIADMQDISVNTAKTRFYSALKKLKSLMEQNHVM